VVTGATGGVGCLAVAILAKLGYRVAAVTGKAAQQDWLRDIGAGTILGREELADSSDQPLLKSRWRRRSIRVGRRSLAEAPRTLCSIHVYRDVSCRECRDPMVAAVRCASSDSSHRSSMGLGSPRVTRTARQGVLRGPGP